MQIKRKRFGEVDGKTVEAFTMKNDHGMEVTCINDGCIITDIILSDKEGNLESIIISDDSIEEYINEKLYLGDIVGRVGEKITDAQIERDSRTYTHTKNEQA